MATNRLIDTSRLTPLVQNEWGAVCSECRQPQANWMWRQLAEGGSPICALCYLYKSEWGKTQGAALPTLVRELEDGWDCRFETNTHGELKFIGDANRVLAALAYLSHTVQNAGATR